MCAKGRYNATTGNYICIGAGRSYDRHAFDDIERSGALDKGGVCRAVRPPLDAESASCVDVVGGKVSLRPGFALSLHATGLLLSAHTAQPAAAPNNRRASRRQLTASPLRRIAVFSCPLPEACYNGTCSPGYSGPLCSRCASGHGRAGLAGTCHACNSGANGTVVTAALLLLALIIFGAAAFVFLRGESTIEEQAARPNGQEALEQASWFTLVLGAMSSVAFQASMKTLVSNIQILSDFEYAFDMVFPAAMRELVRLLKFAALDLFAGLDLRCAFGSYTYVAKLVANLLAPIALLLVVYGVRALVAAKDKSRRVLVTAKAFRMASFVVFLFYPRVSQTIFQGVGCTQLDEGEWWLTVDYQIACSADGWSPMLLPCAVLTILIPVGIPVGMFVVLARLKDELQTSHSHERDKYGFFVGEYNIRHFYWEQHWDR